MFNYKQKPEFSPSMEKLCLYRENRGDMWYACMDTVLRVTYIYYYLLVSDLQKDLQEQLFYGTEMMIPEFICIMVTRTMMVVRIMLTKSIFAL